MNLIEQLRECATKQVQYNDIMSQAADRIAELEAKAVKDEAQMLRMATCAGEFARDVSTPAAPVVAEGLTQDEIRDALWGTLLDAANAYIKADADPCIMIGLHDKQTHFAIGTKAQIALLADGRSGAQIERDRLAAHPVAGSPAEARARHLERERDLALSAAKHEAENANMWRKRALGVEPMPASEAPIGAGDPMAFFADFCDREGYPSDGEMDAALQSAFYEGIRYCAVHTPTAAPVPASEAVKVDTPEFRRLLELHRHCSSWVAEGIVTKIVTYIKSLAAPAAPTDKEKK